MNQGYEALRSGAAWLDLRKRGKIFASGEDRARLLHAMTTNHVQQLQPGQGCYAFFLSAQGRILADVNLFCLEDRFLLDTEPETREHVFQHLDRFIIADDVLLEDVTEQMITLAVEGPDAARVLGAVGAPVPEIPYEHKGWDQAIVARVSFTSVSGYFVFAEVEREAELIRRLESAGAVYAGAEAARIVRLEHGKPRYGEDISDKILSQETQLSHALHFNKGCYLGQEIVERVRSRGLVNRQLVSLQIESGEAPPPDSGVTANGQKVGTITSAAFSPSLGKVMALAYVRREYTAPGTELSAGGHRAEVRPLHTP